MRFADKAAEQFRQAAQLLIGCRFKHRGEDLGRMPDKAITGEAKRDHRIVMRPDRSIVIGNRIETRLAARDRSNSPAAEGIPAEQGLGDARRPFWPAIPAKSAWPAFDVRTRQGVLLPSSAKAKVPRSSHQKAASNFFRRICASSRSLVSKSCSPMRWASLPRASWPRTHSPAPRKARVDRGSCTLGLSQVGSRTGAPV